MREKRMEARGAIGVLLLGALSLSYALKERLGVERVNLLVSRDDRGFVLGLAGKVGTILDELRFRPGTSET